MQQLAQWAAFRQAQLAVLAEGVPVYCPCGAFHAAANMPLHSPTKAAATEVAWAVLAAALQMSVPVAAEPSPTSWASIARVRLILYCGFQSSMPGPCLEKLGQTSVCVLILQVSWLAWLRRCSV